MPNQEKVRKSLNYLISKLGDVGLNQLHLDKNKDPRYRGELFRNYVFEALSRANGLKFAFDILTDLYKIDPKDANFLLSLPKENFIVEGMVWSTHRLCQCVNTMYGRHKDETKKAILMSLILCKLRNWVLEHFTRKDFRFYDSMFLGLDKQENGPRFRDWTEGGITYNDPGLYHNLISMCDSVIQVIDEEEPESKRPSGN